jgi:guanylate kinase
MLDHLRSRNGRVFVISGPSGVGKDVVIERLLSPECRPASLVKCVTATTRDMRPGEKDGIDYHFLSRDTFERQIRENEFLEHAEYNGQLYGTPIQSVRADQAAGNDVLLKIEVQGGAQVASLLPDAILVFLAPPSWEALEARIRGRNTELDDIILGRLEIAKRELEAATKYHYLVVNDTIEDAVSEIVSIIASTRLRIVPNAAEL